MIFLEKKSVADTGIFSTNFPFCVPTSDYNFEPRRCLIVKYNSTVMMSGASF
jgi:hypothetical protein